MPKVNLLIINYNDSKNTIRLIKNVDKYQVINKVYVVDNKSTDDSLEKLNKIENKKIKIIASDANNGYSSAINIGCKYINQEDDDSLIIISNSDIVIPDENTILELIKNFEDKRIGVVMPKILENDDFKYGWKLTNVYKDILNSIPLINRLYRNKFINYDKEYFSEKSSVVDVIYGCFFIIDSKILDQINYFDENVFLYYEENILARKLQSIKRLSLVNNQVFVKHEHNATIGNNVSLLNKYKIYKRSQFYYEKTYNKANFIHMFFFYLFYYLDLLYYEIKLLFK